MYRLCALLALLQGVSAFTVSPLSLQSTLISSTSQSKLCSSPSPDASAAPSSATATSTQPPSYVRCGRCQTSYLIDEQDLGVSNSRRLECTVCGHSWFQSKDRIMRVRNGFQLVELPDLERERIQTNIQEGRDPKYLGEIKLYVGNISFECTEEDLKQVFSEVGPVGDVSLVRDDTGRPKGFGFVTLRKREDGMKALEQLNGMDIKGREIAVRESTN
ncbi:hypothetical protein MPSEU_000837000 [Mayamaea pseudoterrestris]|nr:hypothetical protein MPSEU_000837000 [Mayamaea pseudoterrestris]